MINRDASRALASHKEHSSTWPGGWVRWKNPAPHGVQLLLTLGYLTAGSPEIGTTSVHITEEGRQFLEGEL